MKGERALVPQSKPLLTCKRNSDFEEGRPNASHVEVASSQLRTSEEYVWCGYGCSIETWWTLASFVPWFDFVQLPGRSRLFSGLLITFHPHALMVRISELAISGDWPRGAQWLPKAMALESESRSPNFFPVFSSSLRARPGWFGAPLREVRRTSSNIYSLLGCWLINTSSTINSILLCYKYSHVSLNLTTGLSSEKCMVRRFCPCGNITVCACTSLDEIAHRTSRLYGLAYCFYATSLCTCYISEYCRQLLHNSICVSKHRKDTVKTWYKNKKCAPG